MEKLWQNGAFQHSVVNVDLTYSKSEFDLDAMTLRAMQPVDCDSSMSRMVDFLYASWCQIERNQLDTLLFMQISATETATAADGMFTST